MSNSPLTILPEMENQEKLLVLLKQVQSRFGYLSSDMLTGLAYSLGIPQSRVFGVATFYSLLSVQPQGRNIIKICKSLPCFLKNSELIVNSIEKELGIKPGEVTPDGRFSYQLTNCFGACDISPAIMINDDVYGPLMVKDIAKILKKYQ